MRELSLMLGLSATLALSTAVLAESTFSPTRPPSSNGSVQGSSTDASYRILVGVTHQFDADLDNSGGQFSITRYGIGALVRYPLKNTDFTLSHALSYEHDQYQFSGTGMANPWGDVQVLSYSLNASYKVNQDWTLFAGPIAGVAAENGADWGDALTFGAMAGGMYAMTPNLTVGIGAIVTRPIEDNWQAIPYLALNWKIADGLLLHNARPQPGIRGGPGLELVYTINSQWELAGGFAYDARRFRLDNGNVGQNTSTPVYARLIYSASEDLSVSLMGGVVLGGELRLENRNGDDISSTDYDAAPFIGASVSYRF